MFKNMEDMSMVKKLSTLFLLLSISSPALSGGLIADILRDTGIINADAARALDKAHRDIKQAVPDYGVAEESASLAVREAIKKANEKAIRDKEEITKSVNEAESKLKEINIKLDQIKKLSLKIEAERDQLAKDKTDLEGREKLFSMGFYATLATTIVAVFGIFIRWPNSKLERKLKALEIEHKELELLKLRESET